MKKSSIIGLMLGAQIGFISPGEITELRWWVSVIVFNLLLGMYKEYSSAGN